MTVRIIALSIFVAAPFTAAAEVELSFYGGYQISPGSNVSFSGDSVIPDGNLAIEWDGRSLEAPIYYGLRATYWQTPRFGYGVEFTHNKLVPTAETFPAGFQTLEYTDGLNFLTVNGFRRWEQGFGNITPYVGGGIGFSFPYIHVEYGASQTGEYQIGGPAATFVAGASYPLNEDWSVFGEYKGIYAPVTGNLSTGGTVETTAITNAVNVGVSFNF